MAHEEKVHAYKFIKVDLNERWTFVGHENVAIIRCHVTLK